MGTADVEAVWQIESARIVPALTRFTGDFGLAEDAAQEAVAEALVSWPLEPEVRPARAVRADGRALPGPDRPGRFADPARGPGPAAVGLLKFPHGSRHAHLST
jgi:hypothetical protein